MNAIIIGKNSTIKNLIGDLLGEEFGFEVSFLQFENPLESFKHDQLEKADVILLDLTNGVANSRLFIREIHELTPEAKIIAMHHYNEQELINPFIQAGASAYLLINTTRAELTNAIKAIRKGGNYISDEVL